MIFLKSINVILKEKNFHQKIVKKTGTLYVKILISFLCRKLVELYGK